MNRRLPQDAAHRDGVAAARAGVPLERCPYRDNRGGFRAAWCEGWEKGATMGDDRPMFCGGCRYFDEDRGVWTCTGWTGRGSGACTVAPVKVPRHKDDTACRQGEPRREG